VVRTHQLFFCDVCTENQKLFLHEHTLYTRKDLVAHKRSKSSSGVEMHPKCQFCDTRFFDMDALMMHLTRVSFWCCRRACLLCFYARVWSTTSLWSGNGSTMKGPCYYWWLVCNPSLCVRTLIMPLSIQPVGSRMNTALFVSRQANQVNTFETIIRLSSTL
jgi:hypothetical protein